MFFFQMISAFGFSFHTYARAHTYAHREWQHVMVSGVVEAALKFTIPNVLYNVQEQDPIGATLLLCSGSR